MTNLRQASRNKGEKRNIYLQPSRCWIKKWPELEDNNNVHTALVQQYGSKFLYTNKHLTPVTSVSSAIFRTVQKLMFPSH